MKFSNLFIKPVNYSEESLRTLGWLVYADGDTQDLPFGLLRATKNPNSKELTEEDLEQARNFDLSIAELVPYNLTLCVMPLNF